MLNCLRRGARANMASWLIKDNLHRNMLRYSRLVNPRDVHGSDRIGLWGHQRLQEKQTLQINMGKPGLISLIFQFHSISFIPSQTEPLELRKDHDSRWDIFESIAGQIEPHKKRHLAELPVLDADDSARTQVQVANARLIKGRFLGSVAAECSWTNSVLRRP